MELYEHQKRAVQRWLVEHRLFVAYPAGGGKTLIAIEGLKQIKPASTLIVCPAKVVPQWKKELQKHGLEATVTSYQTLKKLAQTWYDVVICDEAHHLKNRKSGISKLMPTFTQRAPYVLMLSATPSPNRPADIWHPLWLLHGGRVAGTWSRFIDYWTVCSYWEGVPSPGKLKKEVREEFKDYIAQYMCLESATNILDLPDITYTLEPTLKYTTQTLYFTWERASAEKFAEEHHLPWVHGGQTVKKRLKTIEEAIQKGTSLVCTVDSVGEGLDGMQVFQRACFLELVWSPGKLVQAIGRIVRLGSPHKDVTISFIAPAGSRQERMAYLLKQKLIDNAAIYGDEDAATVAQDILGGEMTAEQFDAMWAASQQHAAALPDFGF